MTILYAHATWFLVCCMVVVLYGYFVVYENIIFTGSGQFLCSQYGTRNVVPVKKLSSVCVCCVCVLCVRVVCVCVQ